MLPYNLYKTIFKVFTSCIFTAGLLSFLPLQAQSILAVGPVTPALQTLMRRIYLLENHRGALNSRLIYGKGGKVSLRSHIGDEIILAGQQSGKELNSAKNLMRIIEPLKINSSHERALAESVKPVKDFFFFPNPVSKSQREISIAFNQFEQGSEIKMLLYDGLGRIIVQQNLKVSLTNTISIPELIPGMYYVSVNEKTRRYSKTMLVK